MSVTEYLQRARECAALADKMNPKDKAALLEIAEAWLKLASDAADKAGAPAAPPLVPSKNGRLGS
jgi:hypothetical protein